jgi:hypothetical protein
MRPLRHVLTDLQGDARAVFAGTGESVDRFLTERRQEARQDDDPAA